MSRAVRNALMIAGLPALTWILIVLAWRVAKWLFIAAVWVTALTVAGLILLAQVVTQRFHPTVWITRTSFRLRANLPMTMRKLNPA